MTNERKNAKSWQKILEISRILIAGQITRALVSTGLTVKEITKKPTIWSFIDENH